MSIKIESLIKTTKSLKLLYIEDDEDTRTNTLEVLKIFFNDITVAVDGYDGLDIFKKNDFGLIISDITMPKLDGFKVVHEVQKINKDIPILLLSAHNDSEYFLQAIEFGIDYFIIKPIQKNQFIKALEKIVNKINFQMEKQHYQAILEEQVKERTKELEYKLNYDELTGLRSRFSFFNQIENSKISVVLLVDIDEFKIINDLYGNKIGSKVLSEFAKYLLKATKNESYSVYRLSGDEFAILDIVDFIDTEKYEIFTSNFLKELDGFKVYVDNNVISLDITIGIATTEEDTFENAKIALEYAKTYKKDYIMYSSVIDHRQEQNKILDCRDTIRLAIEDQRVIPVYQPIVDSFGNIVKYETLMRIEKKESNALLYPGEFLSIAIKTRLYDKLSSIVIFNGIKVLEKTESSFSFNFTYSDIKNKSLMHELEEYFESNPRLGERTIFEITESESIRNYDDVKRFIKYFRNYGVQIAIDDFGSGFSNFEYILEIEPDYLKIDGSLIKSIDTDKRSYTLVQAIVKFSHQLGIKVIAEYVHSETIFKMLKVLDVDQFQGFYFSEPLQQIK